MTKSQLQIDLKEIKAFYKAYSDFEWQKIPLGNLCSPTVFSVYRKGQFICNCSSKEEVKECILKEVFKDQNEVVLPAGLKLSVLNSVTPEFEVIGICKDDEGEVRIHYKLQASLKPAIAPQPRLRPSSSRRGPRR